MDKYERLEDLGWKEYRIHYKYRHKESNKVAALKTLRLQSTDDFGIPWMTLRKISLLKAIDHDNVASLLDVIYDERLGHVHLMLEYVDVHLKSLILTNPVRATDRRFIRNTLEQILRGLYCYHSMNIAHGNINPLNVLLDCTNLTAKLTDLDRLITPSYKAPELLYDPSAEITLASDVFSVGCIFAEMLTRRPLFDGPTKYHEILSIFRLVGNFESYSTTNSPEGNRPAASEDPGTKSNILSLSSNQAEWNRITRKLEKMIPDFKPAGIDLLSRMLCPNPSRRITVEESLKHPYFKLGDRMVTHTASMCQVFVASCRKWNQEVPKDSGLLFETQDKNSAIEGSRKLEHSDELECLDKAAVITDAEMNSGDFSDPWRICTVTQVEELKILIRMFPIWASGIVFAAVYAQMSTMFVEQGTMMDRVVGSFIIPAASLSTFDTISVIFWVPVYDRVIVPIARRFTGKERGFSELQRMGIGLFLSVLCMSAAAVVEINRLQLAKEPDLVDKQVPVPINIFWQVPQYFLLGAAEIFTFIGQLEFFYDQSPDAMRSLCSALSLLTTSLGNYLSSLILTIVTYFTTKGGNPGWIPDNLNKGHLDYFFWLLAGLSCLNMLVYVVCAKKYKQKQAS